jgi:hypothetical protein
MWKVMLGVNVQGSERLMYFAEAVFDALVPELVTISSPPARLKVDQGRDLIGCNSPYLEAELETRRNG